MTMRMQEGEQYFVNRLTFVGNTTTRDNVIRRECGCMRAAHSTPRRSNTASSALTSWATSSRSKRVRALMFKDAERKNKVDVTLKLEEQNRNQLTFGAGVSQFEGFFGQLSFQTSNFLGRGEALGVAAGGIALGKLPGRLLEPFLFDRNITGGIDVYKRTLRYIDQFTQEATGGNVTGGFPLRASRGCSCSTPMKRLPSPT